MNITYSSICQKLGFDPMTEKPDYGSGEDDSQKSPFAALNPEELDFLLEYYKNHKQTK